MQKKRTRILCYLLALVMVMSCFCVTSYGLENAQENDVAPLSDEVNTIDDEVMAEQEASVDEVVDVQEDGNVEVPEEPAEEPDQGPQPPTEEEKALINANVDASLVLIYGKYARSEVMLKFKKDVKSGLSEEDQAKIDSFVYTLENVRFSDKTLQAPARFGEDGLVAIKGLPWYSKYTLDLCANGEKIKEVTVNTVDWTPVLAQADVKQVTEKRAYDPKSHSFSKSLFEKSLKPAVIAIEPTVTISWTAPKNTANFDYYQIFVDAKKVAKITSATTTKYTYENKQGGNVRHTFAVKVVYKDGSAMYTNPKKTKYVMKDFLDTEVKTYTFYAKTNQRAKFYKQGSGLAYKRWLPKGVTGTVQGGSGSKFYLEHTKYGSGYVMRYKASCYKIDYSPNVDWSKTDKEAFVNSDSRFKTSAKKIIWVSRYSQTINCFKKNSSGKWQLVRTCNCTTGKFQNYSASGEFKIHTRTYYQPRSSYYYYHLSRYNNANSMHGPTYKKSNDKINAHPSVHLGDHGQYGTLGCVRTYNEDAKWIWDNYGIGDKVVVW